MPFVLRVAPLLLIPGLFWSAQIPQASQAPAVEQTVPPAFDQYALSPESQPQPGVPAGKSFSFDLGDSKIFPGTTRTISVYVPASYTGDKPACLYVGLDGLGFHAATVFDNLIAQHAIPLTIGVGLSSGVVASAQGSGNPRFDRSFEFDSRSDRLARFLLEEVLPAVEQHQTPDGHPIRLSPDRNDRAIGGASTGAIGAFTIAWERPDSFSRVFSAIGTYVGMRGGESYYVLVRKTEPKPFRIFVEDGVHDQWPGGPEMGDWWMSNQTMERALTFAGYDVRHAWGSGTHNDTHASSLFPDAVKWLWRDWPAPVKAGVSANPALQAILTRGEEWQLTAEKHAGVRHLAANARGEIQTSEAGAIAVGPLPDNAVWQLNKASDVITTNVHGQSLAFRNLRVQAFTVLSNGDVYATALTPEGNGELWLVRRDGRRTQLDTGLKQPAGLAFSPDGRWLFVAQSASRQGLSYRVREDGTLDAKAPFYDFYVPAWADESGAGDIAMDREGRAYAASLTGVQVFDRNGRVAAILPLPDHQPVTSLCFGGPDFHTLFAISGGRIYQRRLKIEGVPPWSPFVPLPAGNAG